jgi:hypothetical protein
VVKAAGNWKAGHWREESCVDKGSKQSIYKVLIHLWFKDWTYPCTERDHLRLPGQVVTGLRVKVQRENGVMALPE